MSLPAAAADQQHSTSTSGFCSLFMRLCAKGSAVAADSTALASLHHSACIVIDMGSHLLSECRNRAYTADDAARPCIAGEHVRQVLPEALVDRAALFKPLDQASQVLNVLDVLCLDGCNMFSSLRIRDSLLQN